MQSLWVVVYQRHEIIINRYCMTRVPPSVQTNGTLYHLQDKNHKSQQKPTSPQQATGMTYHS